MSSHRLIPGMDVQLQSMNYQRLSEESSFLATENVKVKDSETPQNDSSFRRSRLPRPRGAHTGLRWWLPEIFASLVSVSSFVALVAVVRHNQGRGLQDVDLPPSLTLPGLIALLSTLIRATFMVPIGSALSQEGWLWLSDTKRTGKSGAQLSDLELSDAASRGAWGSFVFLLQIKRRWLAYLAAIVTILSLVFGTFTQQLISIKSFPVTEDTQYKPVGIPRAEIWNWTEGGTEGAAEGDVPVPLTFKAAAYNGIMNTLVEPIRASCPTGNCTWPITPSLAVCGACSNTTYQRQCNTTMGTETCFFTMPSRLEVTLANTYVASEGDGFKVFPSPGAIYNDSSTLYIAKFETIGAAYGATSFKFNPSINSNVSAYKCAMWMCVQAYQTTMTASEQSQIIVQSHSQLDNASLEALEEEKEVDKAVDIESLQFAAIPENMNPASCAANYSADFIAVSAIKAFMYGLFNGSVFLDMRATVATTDAVQAIWNATSNSSANESNMDTWIKNVAGSLTNVVRGKGTVAKSDACYYGIASHLGYDVHWEWIVLPAALVALSILILVSIIWETARGSVEAWKGSPLALLSTNMDASLQRRAAGQMGRFQGLQKSVGMVKVTFGTDERGSWELKAL